MPWRWPRLLTFQSASKRDSLRLRLYFFKPTDFLGFQSSSRCDENL